MEKSQTTKVVKEEFPLGFQWGTLEPFLFCVHHLDYFPQGNGNLAVDSKYFKDRQIGSDFEPRDGFRMYHGEDIPGFPVHPHRGFETITIVRQGYADHADSMGAAGRYGQGDVQWMTAGSGVQHSEMFPLLHSDKNNTLELFQIWLNLPKKSKMVPAHFTMFWSEKIPKLNVARGQVEISLIAGELDGQKSLKPPPDSWASNPESEIGIYIVKMQTDSEWILPKTKSAVSRVLYFFNGKELIANGQKITVNKGLKLDSEQPLELKNTSEPLEFLVLQAKPIGEPVVQHGPFVMTTKAEIVQTFEDYQRTQFGGWPWDRADMVHGHEIRRFAKYPNGKIETP